MEKFLNFCANFLWTFQKFSMNFSKIFKSLMNTFLLNVPLNRNFGDAIAVQVLSEIHVWNFVFCSTPNQNPGAATGTNSTLCTVYYTKITLLNNLKLTVLLLIVNIHITEIVSRAPRSLICISIGLQLHTVIQCTLYSVHTVIPV